MVHRAGFAAAVLRYRLPADGWAAGADAPVHDAMRAMRLLRERRDAGRFAGAPRDRESSAFPRAAILCARLITEPRSRTRAAMPPTIWPRALTSRC